MTLRAGARSIPHAVLAAAVFASASYLTAAPSSAAPTTIGSLHVQQCDIGIPKTLKAWCGTVTRPLGSAQGRIKVNFAVIARAGANPATLPKVPIVAIEGGPGYGSIDSAPDYARMLGPVLDDRVLVVMDARGTGRSSAIDCPSLRPLGSGSVNACGRYLGKSIGDYASAAAADDLAAILGALDLGTPMVYGDSYGTFLAQVYAGRHPVSALVLDGAYPVSGEDAWYGTQGSALRTALDAVCSRDPSCTPGRTLTNLEQVLALVRAEPRRLSAPGADGLMHKVRIDAPALVSVAFNGTYVAPTVRELDAALSAALSGDWLPLGRLVAEFNHPGGGVDPPSSYSPGLALAVSCHDYPQLFDSAASPPQRRAQVQAAIRAQQARDAGIYAPFTIREYLASDWAEQEDCVDWPLSRADPAMAPASASGMPDVPVLVISGDLDTITTRAEGDLVAAQFPRAQHLVVANGLHVNALGDPDGCAAAAVRGFFTDPSGFSLAGECTLPAIQLAPSYTRSSPPLRQALAQTVADALDRVLQTMGSRGLGLRGGTWVLKGWPKTTITLDGYRLYSDLPVDGTVSWNYRTGAVEAHLAARGRKWSGCWQASTGFGPESTVAAGPRCVPEWSIRSSL